jgi:hypothetical protein
MRQFPTSIQTILNSDIIKYAFLIKLEFNTTYYLTSFNRNITYDGNTYIADGGLYEYDSPKFSSIVDRESYKIIIADILDQMVEEFRINVVGKPITVKVALLDSNEEPLLGSGEVLSVYSGTVDSPSIDNSFEEKLAILEGTSPMSDLDMTRSFLTSKDSMTQNRLNSSASDTDTSFDEVYENHQITLKWGKI